MKLQGGRILTYFKKIISSSQPKTFILSLGLLLSFFSAHAYAQSKLELGLDAVKNLDYELAAEYFEASAKEGDGEASLRLAWQFEKGLGVKRSDAEALYYFNQAALAGYAEGAYRAAQFWIFGGEGVEQDLSRGMSMIQIAAETDGHVSSKVTLGLLYKNGLVIDDVEHIAIDYAKAARWLKKAAMAGDPRAQRWLSWHYAHGLGVNKSDEISFQWAMKSANQGHVGGLRVAGAALVFGRGTNKNISKGIQMVEQAANQGDPGANGLLALLNKSGLMGAPDPSYQIAKLKIAVAGGNGDAMVALGDMYLAGSGVERNSGIALLYWKKALEEGDFSGRHPDDVSKMKQGFREHIDNACPHRGQRMLGCDALDINT